MSDAAFIAFAQTGEGVGATTKRLEKAAILGAYFSTLADDDLLHAARYFAGHTFPLHDARTVNVGQSALVSALLAATGADETHVRTRLVARGDAGDVAGEIFAETTTLANRTPVLLLADVAAFLETLAATSGTKNKVAQIAAMLQRAVPLEAKYLVKLLQADLRIGLKEGAVEDAIARLAQLPVGQVQRANMLTGDIGRVALLARQKQLESAAMQLFHPIKFMLATPAENEAAVARQMPSGFVVEDKFDGIRAQAHVGRDEDGGVRVALYSRTLDEITVSFPELSTALARLFDAQPQGIILDGEIVPVSPADAEKILPFQALQPRLGRKVVRPETLAAAPVAYIAYDALYGDGGRVLLDESFTVRRLALELLPWNDKTVRCAVSETFAETAELDAAFDEARARGNEGLMVKDPASTYKPGRRGREWLKIKRTVATLDVVVTSVQVGEGRRSKFLSDYTFAVRTSETDPALLTVGKAYSGLTDAEVLELSDWFKAHTLQEFAHGKVRLVEPQIVMEITFDRVQASSRHKSGFALRFPRILRIRTDKPPSEIDTLGTVQRLAAEDAGETQENEEAK